MRLLIIILVFVIIASVMLMLANRRAFMRSVWFDDENERAWFYEQCRRDYGATEKSVVLYALRILSRRFGVPLALLESNRTLVDIFSSTYELSLRHKLHRFIGILPDYKNPLQCVFDDFELANEMMRSYGTTPYKPNENLTVKDYVQFLLDFDRFVSEHEAIRCTACLGKIG